MEYGNEVVVVVGSWVAMVVWVCRGGELRAGFATAINRRRKGYHYELKAGLKNSLVDP